MNEKIQQKLATMTAWAEIASYVECKAKDVTESIENLKQAIEEEANKDENERRDWWIKSYQNDLIEENRKLEAYKELQKQIFKLMD